MRTKISLLLLPLMALCLLPACSPDPVDTTGSISGIVYDYDDSDRPLKGVEVTAIGHETRITKTTDAQGNYVFTGIEMGEYTVQASLANYATQQVNVNVAVGQTRTIDFHLRRAASVLKVDNRKLDFGAATASLNLDIRNEGQASMHWEVVENLDWLDCSPRSGDVRAGDKGTILVSVNRSGKAYGDYPGSFVIATADGGSVTIDVTMHVTASDESLPQVSLYGISGETDVTATFSGELIDCGDSPVTHYGFAWSTREHPKADRTAAFRDLGRSEQPRSFTYSPTDLEPNTTYFVRAFAVNADHPMDTVYSRAEQKFTTKPTASTPTPETGAYTALTSSTVTLHANLISLGDDLGVTQHGHIWSATQKDPRHDNTGASEQSRLGKLDQPGSFTSNVTGLKPGTKYYYRAYATNAKGSGYGEVKEFTTPVGEVKLTTSSVSSIIHNEATGGGRITDLAGNTITERGICWGREANPNMSHNHRAAEGNTETWSVRMTGLTEKTTYHVRAYVSTAAGETFFGQDEVFTTTHEIRLPQASGTTVSNVGVTAATLRATVTNDGDGNISDAGFCYSTSPNPSTADNKVSCGVQTSSFTKVLTGLKEDTRYYVRAYVTNERGTGYGEQAELQTLKVTAPSLSATTASGVTFRSATFAAEVTSAGNGTLKRTGFVYATTQNPTLSNHLLNCGTATTLRASTSALTASTTYYVRAFAENEKGVAYGPQLTVTTKEEPDGTKIGLDDYPDDNSWDGK